MRKSVFGICLSLVVAIVLLAALAPSCGPTTGTIVVKATICGAPWQGALNYTLTPTGGSATNGTAVPYTHSSMLPASWTCAYVSGGPGGAYFLNNPSASQSLVAGGTVTFTFDFELKQDAAIKFLAWSVDRVPLLQMPSEIMAHVCQIIDAHFYQWVNGCTGYNVTLNETSLLSITQTAGPPATIVVVDDWCAVNKTPDPRQKVSQTASVDNVTRLKGYNVTFTLQDPSILLDVHTQWQLVKGTNYTKAINWFGISLVAIEPGAHPCVLFELVLPMPGQLYTFTLQASADVALVGDTDVDPANNHDMSGPPITLVVDLR